jgi:hypothetical protein
VWRPADAQLVHERTEGVDVGAARGRLAPPDLGSGVHRRAHQGLRAPSVAAATGTSPICASPKSTSFTSPVSETTTFFGLTSR